MKRYEFLKSMGLGGAAILATMCLGSMESCSSDAPKPTTSSPNSTTPGNNTGGGSSGLDFTLNLDLAANANLKNNGGFVITNGTVVARTTSGTYVAVRNLCTHQNLATLVFSSNGDKFVCTTHGAEYNTAGSGLNENGRRGITVYKTSLDGSNLRVFA